jgi:hypothetical protein
MRLETAVSADFKPAGSLKRTASLLREARSIQRRLDLLARSADAAQDLSLERVAEAQEAVGRLVLELTFRHRGERLRVRASTGPGSR